MMTAETPQEQDLSTYAMTITYTENDSQGGEPLIQMSWWQRATIMAGLKELIAKPSDDLDAHVLEHVLLREFEQIDTTVRANRIAFLSSQGQDSERLDAKAQEEIVKRLKHSEGTVKFLNRRIDEKQAREEYGFTEEEIETLRRERDAPKAKSNCDLTPEELLMVSGVVAYYSNREIAEHFGLNLDTVRHHLANAMFKTEVSDRADLARFAVDHALPLSKLPPKEGRGRLDAEAQEYILEQLKRKTCPNCGSDDKNKRLCDCTHYWHDPLGRNEEREAQEEALKRCKHSKGVVHFLKHRIDEKQAREEYGLSEEDIEIWRRVREKEKKNEEREK